MTQDKTLKPTLQHNIEPPIVSATPKYIYPSTMNDHSVAG